MGAIIKRIVVIAVVVAIIAAMGIYKYKSTVTYYNDTVVNGNTISNLYGKGLFCEANGLIYFANPNDDNALYSMTPNETDVVKICDDRVYYINADDNYLYYCRDNNNDESQMSFLNVNRNSLCRIDLEGKNVKILDNAISQGCSLSGNTILYYHYDKDTATTLYSVGIDGKDKNMLSDSAICPFCIVGDSLYYAGVESDHNLHMLNASSGANSVISTLNLYTPVVVGDYVYYMDLDNNNRISRLSLSDQSVTTLSTYGTSEFNVTSNFIYYQSIKGEPDGIYQINLATGDENLLCEGEYNSINATSKYLYMTDYFSGSVYHCSINGGQPSVFSPAVELEK